MPTLNDAHQKLRLQRGPASDLTTALNAYSQSGEVFYATDTKRLYVHDGTSYLPADRLRGYNVATLPTGIAGDTAYVTDASSPTYLGALTGGGSTVTPVFHNGTSWVAH